MNRLLFSKQSRIFSISICLILFFYLVPNAQNVGIGVATPSRKLSVNGSVAVDYGNLNSGSLDSAALVFGNSSGAGITVKRTGGAPLNGLTIWTNNTPRFTINSIGEFGIGGEPLTGYRMRIYGDVFTNGQITTSTAVQVGDHVAIGGAVDTDYRLRIYGGNARINGHTTITGSTTIGGDFDPEYRLRVIGGNSRFGGDMHATGNAAIGGAADPNFRFRVYDGDSRFGGNVQVTGLINTADLGANQVNAGTVNSNVVNAVILSVDNTLTIGGKGSVQSNGPSSLRMGFDKQAVDVQIAANNGFTTVVNITDFDGDNDDVRVLVSQIVLNAGNTMFISNVNVNVIGVDAANNTCTLMIRNLGVAATLKATIYLTTIAKN
ncbi:MAG: hypothetical protein H7Y31_18120 [Chitinophagaceae bacterium]|nr:hypothetical protein [Chitinophagaceae bacterium]